MSQLLEWPLIKKTDRRTIVSRAVPVGLPILCLAGYLGSDDGLPLWLGALCCVVLVATVVELMSALRYRLEIGDDGIKRRRLREDLRVPWDDVAAVKMGPRSKVILVQRRDGTHLPLEDLSLVEPGKEALVTAMRERAGLS